MSQSFRQVNKVQVWYALQEYFDLLCKISIFLKDTGFHCLTEAKSKRISGMPKI